MILIAFAVAVAAAPLLPPEIARDLRCVAIIGVMRDPALAKDGALYTAIVGANAMDATRQSREAIRDLILAQATRVRATKPSPGEVATCTTQMRARIALERVAP
jgi:hypothetical protein